MNHPPDRKTRWLFAALVLGVAALHQDVWWWHDGTLLFGFLPIGLAYHALYCLLASLTMWALVRNLWPAELEAQEAPAEGAEGAGR